MKSGRRIEELVAPPPRPAKPPRLRPGALPGAVRAPAPASLPPQLAAPAEAPPAGDDWLHEIKFDGYRTLARIEGGAVRLITRGGLDWTRRYGALAEAFAALPVRDALIDGEVVALDAGGRQPVRDAAGRAVARRRRRNWCSTPSTCPGSAAGT